MPRKASKTRTKPAGGRKPALGRLDRSKAVFGSYTEFGYRAVEVAVKNGQAIPPGGSADYQTRYDRERLIWMSQDFDRNNGIYRGTINRALDNIIGNGFNLQARTSDDKLNNQLEAKWAAYCVEPEIRGQFSWWQVERQILRSLFVDGDVGGIKTSVGKIQIIEADRIASTYSAGGYDADNHRVEQGVKLDEYGRALGFYVCSYSPFGMVQRVAPKLYAAKDFVFLANIDRPSQTRGVPVQAANFSMFHRINDVCDAEAIARQIQARFAVSLTRQRGPELAGAEAKVNPDVVDDDSISARIHETPEAIIFHGYQGDEFKGIDRTAPGPYFGETITVFMRLLGLPIGLPLELLMLDWSKTNYSSARAALEQAFRMFKCWQELLKARWHSPIYKWKVAEWIRRGEVKPAADIFEHEWIAPEFPWIDQLKEAEAWGTRMDRGLATQSQALKSLNQDLEQFQAARKREIIRAIELAKEVTKETGTEVPWQMFAGLPMDQKQSASEKPAPVIDSNPENDTHPPEKKPLPEMASMAEMPMEAAHAAT